MKNQYSQSKKNAAELIESARAEYLKKLTDTSAYRELKTFLEKFENNAGMKPFDFLTLDESGYLICRESIHLEAILCTDDLGNPDRTLAESVLNSINECLHYSHETGNHWEVSQCFGEPCIVNYLPERGHYAVYSTELKLKVNRIESEEHGLMLVERAIREHGIFPWIVSCDRSGVCYSLPIPKNIVDASEAELTAMIESIESERNE